MRKAVRAEDEVAAIREIPVDRQVDAPLGHGEETWSWSSAAILACTSLVMLGHEVLLTRVFAVVTFSVHSFVAIAIALLGTGGGALLVYCTRPQRDRIALLNVQLVVLSTLILSVPLTIWAILRIEFVPRDLFLATSLATVKAVSANQRLAALRRAPELFHTWKFYAAMPLACLPFVAAGWLQAVTLRFAPRRFGGFYAADLLGCSAGALLSPLALYLFGLCGTIATFVLLLAIPVGLAWATSRGSLPLRIAGLLATTAAVALSLGGRMEVRHPAGFSEDSRKRSYWSPMGRVALLGKAREMYVIDSTSRTFYAPRTEDTRIRYEPSLYTSAMRSKRGGNLLVIASGGGQEVSMGSWHRMAHIDAAEIAEPIVQDIVRLRRDDPGNPYLLPEVACHVADGRSVAMRSRRNYDMIEMLEVNYHTLAGQIAQAWSADLALTQEAFAEYLGKLKPDGYVCYTSFVGRLRFMSGKMGCVFRSMTAGLRLAGVTRPEKNIVVLCRTYSYGYRVMVMLKPTPFSTAEVTALTNEMAHQCQIYGRAYGVLYAPGTGECQLAALRGPVGRSYPLTPQPSDCSPLGEEFLDVIRETRPMATRLRVALQVKPGREAPLTDECPYVEGSGLFRGSARYGKLIGGTYRTMALTFLALLALLVAGPYALQRWRGARMASTCRWPLIPVVALTGAGFMLMEMSAIYRYQLYLYHPTIAIALVLFSLTLGAGIGSLRAQRQPAIAGDRTVALFSAGAGVIAAGILILAPSLLHELLLSTPLWLLGPTLGTAFCALGFLLGHIVPLALARFARNAREAVPLVWAFATFAGVAGTVGASIMARDIGMSVITWAGAACYLCVALLTVLSGRSHGRIAAVKTGGCPHPHTWPP